MIDSYPLDKGRLYFFLGVNAVLLVYMFFDKKRFIGLFKDPYKFYQSLIRIFLMGFLTLVVSSIFVALSFHSRDLNLIKAFLLFKDIGLKPGGLPYARTMGYQLISFGILTLFVYLLRTSKDNNATAETHDIASDKIIYINGRFTSAELQYAVIATLFLIAPLGLLYSFIGLLISRQFVFNIFTFISLIILCLVWVGLAVIFKVAKKYWIFNISIDPYGITSFGLFQKIHAAWNEITSITVISTGILFGGKMIEIKTIFGNIYFPLTMKEIDKEYPKLDTIGEHWVDSNGNKKPVTPENCLLYSAIKQRKG